MFDELSAAITTTSKMKPCCAAMHDAGSFTVIFGFGPPKKSQREDLTRLSLVGFVFPLI